MLTNNLFAVKSVREVAVSSYPLPTFYKMITLKVKTTPSRSRPAMTHTSLSLSSTKELQSNSSAMCKWCLKPSTNANLTRPTMKPARRRQKESLLKPMRQKTATKEWMKIHQLISHRKGYHSQNMHRWRHWVHHPGNLLTIFHSTLGRSKSILGKDCQGTDQLLTIYQYLWCSTHWKASWVMELLHGVCPATPADCIPMWCGGNARVLYQQWAQET